SGTPGRPTARRRRSSASLALATGGSFKIRWTVRCETRNCAAISLVECPASRRARTACRSSILSILLWPPLHENVGGRPKRRLQMPQDATEFREDRRQSLENPQLTRKIETAVELEIAYAEDCLPRGIQGLNAGLFRDYVRHIADRRLERIGLQVRFGARNPFPWMSETIDLRKEKNFFETTVVEYQSAS